MKNTGFLIVDMQVGFNPSLELIKRIHEAARDYATVVMTRFTNQPESLYRSVLDWQGNGGDLAVQVPNAVILDKSGYGLTQEHLLVLKAMGCDEWHLCGLETDACVLACAFSLWDAGMRPILLPALCDSPLHAEGVAVAQRQFG